MIVEWSETISIPETYWDEWAKEGNYQDTVMNYKGEVIGTVNGLFCGTKLVVGCEDGVIREVDRTKVKIVK